MIACPTCGASNPEAAAWCSQCYARLGQPQEPDSTASPSLSPLPPSQEPRSQEPQSQAPPEGSAGRAPAEVRDGFRHTDGRLEWACVQCGTYNAIEADACTACGTPMLARYAEPERAPEDYARAYRASALLPGAGHYRLGQQGPGLARAVLFVVWILGALVLLLGAERGGFAAAPLLLGALIVYVGTLVDIGKLEAGREELLAGRAMLWLVIGITVLLLVGAFFGARPPAG